MITIYCTTYVIQYYSTFFLKISKSENVSLFFLSNFKEVSKLASIVNVRSNFIIFSKKVKHNLFSYFQRLVSEFITNVYFTFFIYFWNCILVKILVLVITGSYYIKKFIFEIAKEFPFICYLM